MNRIYNVIWSKTKKCYVVVSEIVRGEGKAKTTYSVGGLPTRLGALMAATALLLGSSLTPVQGAAIIIEQGTKADQSGVIYTIIITLVI